MSRLEGKVAIITGAAGGIGREAARLFESEGADVLAVDVNVEALERAIAEIGSNRISSFVADVANAADNRAMVACAVERYGGVDVLLANAGIEGHVRPMLQYDEEMFDKVMNINVKGPFLGIQAVVPPMIERGGGSIVITSSVAGLRGSPGITPYSTSKHAVIGLMRSAAKEFAANNIRVNTVNPSPVETEMMRRLERGMSSEAQEATKARIASTIPMGRYADPSEIAKAMLFLASEDSAWITGAVHAVDGGNTA